MRVMRMIVAVAVDGSPLGVLFLRRRRRLLPSVKESRGGQHTKKAAADAKGAFPIWRWEKWRPAREKGAATVRSTHLACRPCGRATKSLQPAYSILNPSAHSLAHQLRPLHRASQHLATVNSIISCPLPLSSTSHRTLISPPAHWQQSRESCELCTLHNHATAYTSRLARR